MGSKTRAAPAGSSDTRANAGAHRQDQDDAGTSDRASGSAVASTSAPSDLPLRESFGECAILSQAQLASLAGIETEERCPFYDEQASEKLSRLELLRCVVWAPFAYALTLTTFAGLFLYWGFVGALDWLCPVATQERRHKKVLHWVTTRISRFCLFANGWRYEVHGLDRLLEARMSGTPFLVVSNHVSNFDSAALASTIGPFAPVAFTGVRSYYAIGRICVAWNALFVDREARGLGRTRAIREHAERLTAPALRNREVLTPLLLFPEASTTNNRALGRFKKGAFVPGLPVLPIVLKYETDDGKCCGWVAPRSLHCHTLRLWSRWFAKKVTVSVLPLHTPTQAEAADPELFSQSVQDEMASVLRVPACRAWGIEECRALYSKLDDPNSWSWSKIRDEVGWGIAEGNETPGNSRRGSLATH